jgi:Transglycosylase SLT domain
MDFSKLSKEQMAIAEMVIEAADQYKIDPNLLLAQAFQESGFSHIPSKDPKSDAFGVMQIRPSTAEQNKLGDTKDLQTNIYGGAKLMKQYLDQYKSPEAALLAYHQGPGVADEYIKSGGNLKSVGPKGLDYVINIGENGGFGQQPATENAEEPPPKPPFVPVADTFPPPEADKPEVKPENVVSPMGGAALGAVASTVGQVPFKPDLEYAKPPPDVSTAENAANKAQRQFDIAEERLNKRINNAMPIAGGTDLPTLEAEYKRSQFLLQQAEKELQAATAAQKAKVAPTPPSVGSMASATPQIITDPNAPIERTSTERMMQGKIDPETGNTGRQNQNYNEVTSFRALQAAEQQKALEQAAKTGAVPDSGQRARLAFGMPDATPSGILVQPDVAAPLKEQQALDQKMADDKAAQERLSQQNEMNRLKNEKALAAQQNSQAQNAFNQAQRAKTAGVARAQNTMETAEDRARLLAQDAQEARLAARNAPSTTSRLAQNTGVAIGKGSNIVKGGLGAIGGYQAAQGINTLANLPLAVLQKKYEEGDRSPQLMDALAKAAQATAQVGFGTAAAMPAIGATGAKIKGAGLAGTAALGALQLYQASKEKALQRRNSP